MQEARATSNKRPIVEVIDRLKVAVADLENGIDALKDKCDIYMIREEPKTPQPPSSSDAVERYNIPSLDELDNIIIRICTCNEEITDILNRLG